MKSMVPGKCFSGVWQCSALCILFSAASLAAAAEEPEVTPYRPTVSNPAALSAPGWLEMEAGWQRLDDGDDTRRSSLPYLLKFAFTPDWGILVGGDALVRQTDAEGTVLSGFGDTFASLKYRLPVTESAAFGVEAGFKAPTSRTGLGNDKTDYLVTGIFSTEVARFDIDLNLGAVRLGTALPDAGRVQATWAASIARSASEAWTFAFELSGSAQRGVRGQSQALLAATYLVNKRVALDAGVARGLSRDGADWSVFAGATILLGKLW